VAKELSNKEKFKRKLAEGENSARAKDMLDELEGRSETGQGGAEMDIDLNIGQRQDVTR
jgi:hypothetical protein